MVRQSEVDGRETIAVRAEEEVDPWTAKFHRSGGRGPFKQIPISARHHFRCLSPESEQKAIGHGQSSRIS